MKKRMRILLVFLLIFGLSGSAVLADDPAVNDGQETQTEAGENKDKKDKKEKKEEKDKEEDKKPEEDTSEDPSENTEEETTEKKEEDSSEESSENQEDTSEEGGQEQSSEQSQTITPTYSSAEIAALRQKYSENLKAKQEVQARLNEMKKRQNAFIENLQDMDQEIIDLQDQIDTMEAEQRQVDAAVEQLRYEMEFAEQDVNAQYQKLKKHIQNAYENGNYSYMDALLHAVNFADILNKTEYVQQVSAYDAVLLDRYRESRERLANRMKMLETMTSDFSLMQQYYQDKQDALVLLSDEKEKQILKYQTEIDEEQKELTKLQVEEQIQANQISQIEASARTTVTYTITKYEGGTLIWPQPSSTTITSDFGYRGDIGVPGATAYHQGIDISASMYDPVVAAADGKIIYVGYFGTGGKTVMIDIGGGITLVYHHLNDYAVEIGDVVEGGQVVGRVGMTGATSGPHLHFSVRVNGAYVNPKPYLGI